MRRGRRRGGGRGRRAPAISARRGTARGDGRTRRPSEGRASRGTPSVDVHPRILADAPDAPIIVKEHADSFANTTLEATLAQLGATELLVCGMMTQNCVTHTAISKAAEKYDAAILVDGCTTVNEMIHNIALHAVATRVRLVPSSEAL